jgi:hypothetical protein
MSPVSDMAVKSVDAHVAGNLAWAVERWSNNTEHRNWGAVDERNGNTWNKPETVSQMNLLEHVFPTGKPPRRGAQGAEVEAESRREQLQLPT